jgi:glucose/arabinose dehydrogenase
MLRRFALATLLATTATMAHADSFMISGDKGGSIRAEVLDRFDGPWAMTWLPDGHGLVTEKSGTLWLIDENGRKRGTISGLPAITPRGQGGLGDVILHPDHANNRIVYISYVERDPQDDGLSGAAVDKARLVLDGAGGRLEGRTRIWEQMPKVRGNGHYGHRLAFAPDGHLFITSGERQKFTPAQNMAMNLGKMIRLTENGDIPADNPFVGQGGVAEQVWSLGHRNPLGVDFDANGQLWAHEMGPRHGDELNRIVRGENYGYPNVSNGDHYSGVPIPDHETNPAYENPAAYWVPAISPAGFVIYDGSLFDDWTGNGLIGGLGSQALVRVRFMEKEVDNTGAPPKKDGPMETVAEEVERYGWGARVREVEEGPDGAVYILEDGSGGRLLKLNPS